MKKIMFILGMAMMLFCGCGNTENVEAETVSYMDTKVEQLNEQAEDMKNDMIDLYTRALEEIYGEDLETQDYEIDDIGITINGRFTSWEYIEEVAYNLMMNE